MILTLVSGAAAPRATVLSASPGSHRERTGKLALWWPFFNHRPVLNLFCIVSSPGFVQTLLFLRRDCKTQNPEFPDMTESMCSGIQNAKGGLKTEHPEKIERRSWEGASVV